MFDRNTAGALAILGLSTLAACGRDGDATRKGADPAEGATARDAPALPAPRGKPDGVAWDALAWVRSSDAPNAEATVIDAVATRAAILSGRRDEAGKDLADTRRWLVRHLGLPEDAARVVVTLRESENDRNRVVQLRAAKVKTSLDDVRKAALAHGGVEGVQDGVPSWRTGSGYDTFVTVWADGWLLRTRTDDIDEIGRALAARTGKNALRGLEGLAEAFSSLPDSLPVQVAWGPKAADLGPGVVPPRVGVTAVSAADPEAGFAALVFASEAERASARRALEESIADAVKAGDVTSPTFADRGKLLLIGMKRSVRPEALVRHARNDLQALRAALHDRRHATSVGRFPTTAEGLASLESDAASLDEFLGVLPKDPWGRPYHYASPHPTKFDDVDVRSAGPDGKIDTADDVLPE